LIDNNSEFNYKDLLHFAPVRSYVLVLWCIFCFCRDFFINTIRCRLLRRYYS